MMDTGRQRKRKRAVARVGQKFVRVEWRREIPHLVVGTVYDANSCSFAVEVGGVRRATRYQPRFWESTIGEAIAHGMRTIFSCGGDAARNSFGLVPIYVDRIISLRRMERRMAERKTTDEEAPQ